MIHPISKEGCYKKGLELLLEFCRHNDIEAPGCTRVEAGDWQVHACAFYRPDTEIQAKYRLPNHGAGINICLTHCGVPCAEGMSRNWSWPGNVIDRTPYGVVVHELGHHCDWLVGERKWSYGSEWCSEVQDQANELPLTTYAGENPAEYLAEAFRLFCTNPCLLEQLRPKTYGIITVKYRPVPRLVKLGWRGCLGDNVPGRVLRSIYNKGVV